MPIDTPYGALASTLQTLCNAIEVCRADGNPSEVDLLECLLEQACNHIPVKFFAEPEMQTVCFGDGTRIIDWICRESTRKLVDEIKGVAHKRLTPKCNYWLLNTNTKTWHGCELPEHPETLPHETHFEGSLLTFHSRTRVGDFTTSYFQEGYNPNEH